MHAAWQTVEKSGTCFDKLSMNGFFSTILNSDPFALSSVEGFRSVLRSLLVSAGEFMRLKISGCLEAKKER